jgi:hypothetical protein
MRSIRKSFAAIIRKLFTGRKKARREPKPSADGTFNRDAVRRLQRHLQTARRRDSRPVSLSQGRNPHEEYVGQRHGVRLSKMSVRPNLEEISINGSVALVCASHFRILARAERRAWLYARPSAAKSACALAGSFPHACQLASGVVKKAAAPCEPAG